MNTNPDETKLALWLDDELTGAELAEMEAWAAENPEQLAAREELRGYRNMMTTAVPASEEPPYPDFFLNRIHQGIRDLQLQEPAPASLPAAVPFWKSWLFPLAACAGMVIAFEIGRKTMDPRPPLAIAPPASPAPAIYTPEAGVDAQWIASSGAGGSVIVLRGVSAIPDSTDFSATVHVPTATEADRTAGQRKEDPNSSTQ